MTMLPVNETEDNWTEQPLSESLNKAWTDLVKPGQKSGVACLSAASTRTSSQISSVHSLLSISSCGSFNDKFSSHDSQPAIGAQSTPKASKTLGGVGPPPKSHWSPSPGASPCPSGSGFGSDTEDESQQQANTAVTRNESAYPSCAVDKVAPRCHDEVFATSQLVVSPLAPKDLHHCQLEEFSSIERDALKWTGLDRQCGGSESPDFASSDDEAEKQKAEQCLTETELLKRDMLPTRAALRSQAKRRAKNRRKAYIEQAKIHCQIQFASQARRKSIGSSSGNHVNQLSAQPAQLHRRHSHGGEVTLTISWPSIGNQVIGDIDRAKVGHASQTISATSTLPTLPSKDAISKETNSSTLPTLPSKDAISKKTSATLVSKVGISTETESSLFSKSARRMRQKKLADELKS